MAIKKKKLLDRDLSFGRVKVEDKIQFAQHLAIMLKSGLAITEAMEIVLGQTKGRMKGIVAYVKDSIESGNSLSSSLSKYGNVFSNMFISTVFVGESSGLLGENLETIAKRISKEKALKDKVKGAMFYPLVIMGLAFALGGIMSFVVLPKILPLFKGLDVDLPMSTRALIWFSDVIQAYGGRILISLAVFFISFFWFIRQKFSRPITNYVLLKMPIVKGITINNNLAMFCGTLGTLLKSGLNIDEAIHIARGTVSNYYYQKSLDKIVYKTRQGIKLSVSLAEYKNLFPDLIISMIKVGERSGRLEETLFYLSEHYEMEVNNATKRLSTAIEPILLIGIGLFVGGLAVSIITPIYQLTGDAGK